MTLPGPLDQMTRPPRRPGDLVFAWVFFALSLFLLSQVGSQSPWAGTQKIFTQPAFWPTVSLAAMTLFSGLHLWARLRAPRTPGRWREVSHWLRALEFAGWFLVYVALVPWLGYLPATVLAAVALALRAGYRRAGPVLALAGLGVLIVVLFRGLLQVKIPAGALYEYLPDGLRLFMLSYL